MTDQRPTARTDGAAALSEVDKFLADIGKPATAGPARRGRLVFALDATMSRQPTWDMACELQAEMFREVATTGGLDMQLVYYRGLGECRASRWISQPRSAGQDHVADHVRGRPHPDRKDPDSRPEGNQEPR